MLVELNSLCLRMSGDKPIFGILQDVNNSFDGFELVDLFQPGFHTRNICTSGLL